MEMWAFERGESRVVKGTHSMAVAGLSGSSYSDTSTVEDGGDGRRRASVRVHNAWRFAVSSKDALKKHSRTGGCRVGETLTPGKLNSGTGERSSYEAEGQRTLRERVDHPRGLQVLPERLLLLLGRL